MIHIPSGKPSIAMAPARLRASFQVSILLSLLALVYGQDTKPRNDTSDAANNAQFVMDTTMNLHPAILPLTDDAGATGDMDKLNVRDSFIKRRPLEFTHDRQFSPVDLSS